MLERFGILVIGLGVLGANLALGHPWPVAAGVAAGVGAFGEVTGQYVRRPRLRRRIARALRALVRWLMPLETRRGKPRGTTAGAITAAAERRRRELNDVEVEVGLGLGVMALGVAALTVPPDVARYLNPTWLCLLLIVVGLAVCLVSIATYIWDRVNGRG